MDKKEFVEMQIGALEAKPYKPRWTWNIAVIIICIMLIAFCTQREGIAFGIGFLAAIISLAADQGGRSIATKDYWKEQL